MKVFEARELNNRLKPAKDALEGFPWRLATILYTLSWVWSLLRPNTLYWDDWAFIYGQPKTYLNQIFVDTGLPPWRAIIDQELIAIGYWTIPLLTFFMFFASGICIFLIFKKIRLISEMQNKFITLLFLLLPINHSRIALVLFGYTSSYFLFFVAWLLLIRSKKFSSFLIALVLFFWSFMTHSFLFFYALPLLHFVIMQYPEWKIDLRSFKLHVRTFCLFSLPFCYYILRSFFWYPKPEWDGYHSITFGGLQKGLTFGATGLLIIGVSIFVFSRFKSAKKSLLTILVGWLIFAWSLLPYFANGRLPDFISVFAFRSDWGGRHIMLTPLGAALMLSGVLGIMPTRLKKTMALTSVAMCLVINVFFGSQFYLDSIKKEELTNLFVKAGSSQKINSESDIYFVDDTKIFNGRFSTYRDPELRNKLIISRVNAKSITGKASCQDAPNAIEFALKTKKSYLAALLSGDLGLYLEINKC
jgi:hypothetical protein